MKRGDLVTIALQGDFGKARLALVIQANPFSTHTSTTVLLMTSKLVFAPLLRVTVQPSTGNGLQKISQVMVDKAVTVKRQKLGPVFRHMDAEALVEIERCLAVFLGITK
ncbi:MAG: type II toxin-antitoxin system PemK/MazF family toxin [Rhodoferax sp.]|nr:type II toxin-antitoxin system PemK/MazF family toxin [Rhodoferax sp.]